MDKEFEKAFISCCLKKPSLIQSMQSGIKADMFDNNECKIIWNTMCGLSDKVHKVDVSLFPAMIVGELAKSGLSDYVSETTFLSLSKMDVNPKNISTYSKPMRDKYKRQALQSFTNEMSKCLKENCDFNTIKKIYQKLSIIDSHDDLSQPQSLVDIIDNNISNILDEDKSKSSIWQTGFDKFDNFLRFMAGNLYCIGGRPGSGKSVSNITQIMLEDGSFKEVTKLHLGQRLASIDGEESVVLGIYPQGKRRVWIVSFDSGQKVRCSGDHLWTIEKPFGKELVTTKQMFQEFVCNEQIILPKSKDIYGKWLNNPVITAIEVTNEYEDMTCIMVSHPSKLYLLENYIPTHNTTVARSMMYKMAYRRGYKILFFSLEMCKEEIEIGFTCSRHSISFDQFIQKSDDERIFLLEDFRRHLIEKNIDITIDDESMDCDAIVSNIMRINDEKGVDVVFIDYLQLMSVNGMKLEEGASENILLTVILKKLKACAKHIRKPIILLSQLSRKVEEREDKTPMLSDLRSSGSIEQDCTGVIFLYRDEYYKKSRTLENRKGKIDLIIAKNRWGKVGTLEFNFKGEYGQVYE